MKSTPNEVNKDLLLNSPSQFLVANQRVVDIVVSKYIKHGFIPPESKDDVIQNINLKLLDGIITKMQTQYDETFFVSTYFATIVKNLCRQYIINLKKQGVKVSYDDFAKNKSTGITQTDSVAFEREIKRLDYILRMHGRKMNKLINSLKLRYRLEITDNDVENLRKDGCHNINWNLYKLPPSEIAEKKEAELFDYYAPLLGHNNGKQVSGDSLKRWTYIKIDEIVGLLNENKVSSYDSETLGILLEKYLEKNSN